MPKPGDRNMLFRRVNHGRKILEIFGAGVCQELQVPPPNDHEVDWPSYWWDMDNSEEPVWDFEAADVMTEKDAKELLETYREAGYRVYEVEGEVGAHRI